MSETLPQWQKVKQRYNDKMSGISLASETQESMTLGPQIPRVK